MAKKPTARQLKFVDLYLCDPERNASKAYREAGFKSKNPDVDAAQLLVNPSIQPLIQAGIEKIKRIAEEKFEITQERILEELAMIAFTRPSSLSDWTGDKVTAKKKHEMTKAELASIAGVEQVFSKRGVKSIKFHHYDRVSILKMLGQHTGLWSKLNGKNGSGTLGRDPKAALARISELVRKRRK